LPTVDAFISCRLGRMTISKGNENKQVTFYPPTKYLSELEKIPWFEETDDKEETIQSLQTIVQTIK